MKNVMHLAVLEIEFLALLSVVAFSVLIQLKPTGIMTSAEGDSLRYCFTEGQDDLLSRCQQIQVAFMTKKVPKAFSDPKLVVYDKFTPENRYAWHEIKAPVGTIGYRFDYHWKRGVQPSRTGPEVREIWLGKRRVTWDEMKSDYEVYEPLSVPCYWFRPQWFFNLDGRDFAKWLLGYFLVVNVLLTSVWFGISRGKNV